MGDDNDTLNDFLVGVRGGQIVCLNPPRVMTKQQALRLAAYLVTFADDDDTFPAVLAAVQST